MQMDSSFEGFFGRLPSFVELHRLFRLVGGLTQHCKGSQQKVAAASGERKG